jgi:hypothetical protein
MFLSPNTPKALHKMWIKVFNDIGNDKQFHTEMSRAFGFQANAADGNEISKEYNSYIASLKTQGIQGEVRARFNAMQKNKKKKKKKKK